MTVSGHASSKHAPPNNIGIRFFSPSNGSRQSDLGGSRWPEIVSIIFRQFLQPIVESFQIRTAEFVVGFQIVAFSPLVP